MSLFDGRMVRLVTFTLLCLGLMWVVQGEAGAASDNFAFADFTKEELAFLAGVSESDVAKVTIDGEYQGAAVRWWVEIYRNDGLPKTVSEVDHGFEAQPDATIELGILSPGSPGGDVSLFLLATPVDGGIEYVAAYRRSRSGSTSMGRMKREIALAERADGAYVWSRDSLNAAFEYDTPIPVHMLRGVRVRNGKATSSGYRSDDVNIQAQLHDVVVVTYVQVSKSA